MHQVKPTRGSVELCVLRLSEQPDERLENGVDRLRVVMCTTGCAPCGDASAGIAVV